MLSELRCVSKRGLGEYRWNVRFHNDNDKFVTRRCNSIFPRNYSSPGAVTIFRPVCLEKQGATVLGIQIGSGDVSQLQISNREKT